MPLRPRPNCCRYAQGMRFGLCSFVAPRAPAIESGVEQYARIGATGHVGRRWRSLLQLVECLLQPEMQGVIGPVSRATEINQLLGQPGMQPGEERQSSNKFLKSFAVNLLAHQSSSQHMVCKPTCSGPEIGWFL